MKELFLNRAKENLKAAEVLFEMDLFNASANRAYYSSFHAALTYLFYQGLNPAVDHRNVLSMFVNEFINKKKIFPSILKSTFYNLQNVRNDADYRAGISKSTANRQLKNAKIFVENIYKEIEK
jgi:uncharacterized protein (UPF0332 family)